MTHPVYTAKHLLKKGISHCKQIAKELGVSPEGDKRQLFTWVEAITQYQSTQVQEVEAVEATIDFHGDCYEGLTEPYVVLAGGKVVHRTATYQQAVRHCQWQGYTLLDSQTLAQNELEAEEVQVVARKAKTAKTVEVLEQHQDDGFIKFVVQSGENIYTVTPAHPVNNQRCECGDNHFRGAECKHQIAVKNAIASRISFISPTDFGYYEAIVDNDIHHVIAKIYFSDRDCDQPCWSVEMSRKSRDLASYEEAEQFIKDEYVNDVMDGRTSGRIEPVIEDTSMTIEYSNFVHDFGQSYTLRINGALAGSIFLDDDHGWTMNGEDYDDWQPVANQLIRLTRREYLVA